MTNDQPDYEIAFHESQGDWLIIHRQLKGSVVHRTILAERYASEEDASDAAEKLRNA